MKIYYANASYKKSDIRGRSVHIRQFIDHSLGLGHEIWMNAGTEYPGISLMPKGRWARLKRFRNMDVIYVRLQGDLSGACKYTTQPYRFLFGSPINVWEFNTFPIHSFGKPMTNLQKKEKLAQFRRYGKRCDLAVCVSKTLADYVQEQLFIQHTLVVPNGSDPVLFDPALYKNSNLEKVNPTKFNVLWMGSADLFWNDFEQLVSAVRILNEHGYGSKIDFNIIGVDMLDFSHIPANVYCHGKVDYEKLPPWLAKMDLGLILYKSGSADYNSPLKLFDYLASEMAVISNDHPQVHEVLSKIDADDLICHYGDAEDMAKKIERLVNNPDRVNHLGAKGRALVLDHYNWKRAVKDTYDTILKIRDYKENRIWKIRPTL